MVRAIMKATEWVCEVCNHVYSTVEDAEACEEECRKIVRGRKYHV